MRRWMRQEAPRHRTSAWTPTTAAAPGLPTESAARTRASCKLRAESLASGANRRRAATTTPPARRGPRQESAPATSASWWQPARTRRLPKRRPGSACRSAVLGVPAGSAWQRHSPHRPALLGRALWPRHARGVSRRAAEPSVRLRCGHEARPKSPIPQRPPQLTTLPSWGGLSGCATHSGPTSHTELFRA